jgi:hypothetical protein
MQAINPHPKEYANKVNNGRLTVAKNEATAVQKDRHTKQLNGLNPILSPIPVSLVIVTPAHAEKNAMNNICR